MIYGFGADRNGLTQFMTTVIDANGHRKESYRDVNDMAKMRCCVSWINRRWPTM